MEFVEPIREKEKIVLVKSCFRKRRDFLLFLMGINSGLRISDILRLKVGDVANKEYIEIIEQKTGKRKKFPITYAIREDFNEYILNRDAQEWLFKSQRGNCHITRIQAYRIIKRACAKAGILVNTGTHTLRKTFGYHFYQEKKDIALLQYLFNHSNPSITLRYIGINQDMVDESLKDFYL